MHIHKPKPIHGWREFLKEYAIIVLGVLTAIGLDLAVETLHHREIVNRVEDALRENFTRFVKFKAMADQEEPCMAARAAEIRAILDEAGRTRRLARVGTIPQPTPMPWQIHTWEAMVASGAAPYLPNYRTVNYSRIAMSAIDLYTVATSEWEEWGALRSLSGPPRPFSDAEEAMDRDTLARAVEQARLVRFFAANTVPRIKTTHLLDQKALDEALASGRRSEQARSMCHPIEVGER